MSTTRAAEHAFSRAVSIVVDGSYAVRGEVRGTDIRVYEPFGNRAEIEAAYGRSYSEGCAAYAAEGRRLEPIVRAKLYDRWKAGAK